ncbi:MAG: glycosyltransferase family 1 protein [Acidimicrobiales bacterium]
MSNKEAVETEGQQGLDVAIVAEPLRRPVSGGIGTYTRSLVKALAAAPGEHQVRCRLVASRAPRLPDPLEQIGVPVAAMALPSALLVRAWDLGFARVGRGSDVVHAVSLMVPPSSAPLSVALHDIAFRSVPDAFPPQGLAWHERALRRVARRAQLVIVPSLTTKEALIDARLRLEDRIVVIEYGADHLPPPDEAATEAVLRRLGVEGEYLLAVGTLEPRKNLRRLVAAYESARSELPGPAPLVVVGPYGWGRGRPEHSPGVVFAGAVTDPVLAGLYRRALACCYVPLVEGFGFPVVEAMRLGTPVVASAVPSSGGAALEVDPLDVDAMGDALVRVTNDQGLRARLADSGSARASALTWAATASAHARAWRERLGRRP